MAQATVSVTFTKEIASVRLVCSTSSDLSNPVYSPASGTTNQTVKLTITGLAANTLYYYGVEVSGTLQTTGRGQFKTFPASGTATNFTCAFASCSISGTNHTVFTDIKNYNPAFFIHMGDFHYQNISSNDITLYRNAYNNVFAQPNPAALYANVPTIYMWDDHDYGEDGSANGDGSNKNNVAKTAAHAAYRERVPHYTLAGTTTEPIYQSFVYGRIRFIVLDIHTAKDRYTDADSSVKTMIGATQKAWLKNQLIQPEPVKVIVNGQPWIDTANDDDNWTYFATERKEIMDFIKSNNLMDKIMMFSGDMHALAIDDGTNNSFATGGGKGFPVFQAAPLDQSSSSKGGPYQQGPYQSNGQFGLMSVTDNGTTISVQWTGKRGTIDVCSLALSFSGATYSQPVVDTTPPNNVTNLATSNLTSTGVTLSWTASNSTDIASYDIYNGATLLGNTATTTYNVSGLTGSTGYTLTVKAKDVSGNVASGTSISFTTLAATDTTPPNNVTNLATSNLTATSLTLSWTASTSTDVASYDIYNGASLLGSTATTSYNVTGLTGSTTYTFYVKAKDTSNNVASGTSVTVTTPTGITYIASDSFDRADSTTTLGTTNSYVGGTAKTWTTLGTGAYGISANKAYCPTQPTSGHNVAVIDAGQSDYTIECDITIATGDAGPKIAVRVQDQENMILFALANDGTGMRLYYYSNGNSTDLATLGTEGGVSGAVFKIVCSGSTITCYQNGVQKMQATNVTVFPTATKVGIMAYKYPNSRFDNFKVY